LVNNYLTPVGVNLKAAGALVYTAPVGTSTMLIVYFSNVDVANRKLNAYLHTGALPAAGVARDALAITAKDFTLVREGQLQAGPFYLTTGYKVTAFSDVDDKITAVPVGVETT